MAAGPIEGLINHHGVTYLDEIETCARRNKAFRKALADVWLRGGVSEEVRKRLRVIMPDVEQGDR